MAGAELSIGALEEFMMGSQQDFVMEDHILTKYRGPGSDVTIPVGVTKIGLNAFKDCTGLTSVTSPESVTEMDWGAFEGCTGLTGVTILSGVTEIDLSAFEGCKNLTIHAPAGSAAEQYAEDCRIPFQPL